MFTYVHRLVRWFTPGPPKGPTCVIGHSIPTKKYKMLPIKYFVLLKTLREQKESKLNDIVCN